MDDVVVEELVSLEEMESPAVDEPSSEEVVLTDVEKESELIIISTLRTGFDQQNVVVPYGSEVTWENEDDRVHKIACYHVIDKAREFLSPQLKEGESFSYRFMSSGSYECRDAVFGYWGNLMVLADDTPTGLVSGTMDYGYDNPFEIILLVMVIFVFSIYGYQRYRRNH